MTTEQDKFKNVLNKYMLADASIIDTMKQYKNKISKATIVIYYEFRKQVYVNVKLNSGEQLFHAFYFNTIDRKIIDCAKKMLTALSIMSNVSIDKQLAILETSVKKNDIFIQYLNL